MARYEHSEVFLRWLTANGIITDRTRAVTIRARIGERLTIDVEMIGDENLMSDDARTIFESAEVRRVKNPKGYELFGDSTE